MLGVPLPIYSLPEFGNFDASATLITIDPILGAGDPVYIFVEIFSKLVSVTLTLPVAT
jgi:hypothetical protein